MSACLAVNTAVAAEAGKFILGTGTEDQVFTGAWERMVYVEAFRRLGVPLEIVVAPLKRLELMLERGEIDGETMRGPVYGRLHPQLIPVELPGVPSYYSLYALRPVPGLTGVDDLRGGKFRGSYRRGVLFCQSLLKPLLLPQGLAAVTTVKQAIDMLVVDHTDFFCDVNLGVWNHEYSPQQGQGGPRLYKLFDVSGPVFNGGYLHEKHAQFAIALTAVLKQMDKEGLLEKYRLDAMARLQPK
ncbi:hypothetical protein WG899_11640 [Paucibacter sp. AS339]|uniref:hypothetical protein n=1 Tax=Paucibacter hankyongi TaxID=3133434 RepID=UPI0030A7A635